MITTIIKYWKLVSGLLLTFGGFLVGLLLMQSGKNREEKKQAEARSEHLKEVMIGDKEIEIEHDARTEELAEQVESDGVSDELANPKW